MAASNPVRTSEIRVQYLRLGGHRYALAGSGQPVKNRSGRSSGLLGPISLYSPTTASAPFWHKSKNRHYAGSCPLLLD